MHTYRSKLWSIRSQHRRPGWSLWLPPRSRLDCSSPGQPTVRLCFSDHRRPTKRQCQPSHFGSHCSSTNRPCRPHNDPALAAPDFSSRFEIGSHRLAAFWDWAWSAVGWTLVGSGSWMPVCWPMQGWSVLRMSPVLWLLSYLLSYLLPCLLSMLCDWRSIYLKLEHCYSISHFFW